MNVVQFDPELVQYHFEQLFALKFRSLCRNVREGECIDLEKICREKLLELSGYMEQGKAVVFGAVDGEVLRGFLWAYPRTFFNQPRMFVNGIAVREEDEGAGIAKQLMQELVSYAKERHYAGIDLTVAPFNERAVGFYRHLGFEVERLQMMLSL